MTTNPQFIMIDGQAHKPVVIPATGQYQLMRLESVKSYILVHPNGRQAWFHDNDIARTSVKIAKFRYTDNPLQDLQRLIKAGLKPFHVDADFDPSSLAGVTR